MNINSSCMHPLMKKRMFLFSHERTGATKADVPSRLILCIE